MERALISVAREGRSEIATGSTKLEPGDRVLAILQPGCEDELRRVLLKRWAPRSTFTSSRSPRTATRRGRSIPCVATTSSSSPGCVALWRPARCSGSPSRTMRPIQAPASSRSRMWAPNAAEPSATTTRRTLSGALRRGTEIRQGVCSIRRIGIPRRAAGERDGRPLDDHREGDGDEDERVDQLGVVHASPAPRRRRAGSAPRLSGRPRAGRGARRCSAAPGRSSRPADERAGHEDEQRGDREALEPEPVVPDDRRGRSSARARRRRRPRRGSSQRGVEGLDLGLEGNALVADQDPGHEDGEEARAVRHAGQPVDDAAGGESAQGVEARAREPASASAARAAAGDDPEREPDSRRDGELAHDQRRTSRGWRWRTGSSPSISAIPTGSLAPDSPSRMVSVRPPTSRPPSTENITAGSVGASAAPIRPEIVQPRPSRRWQPAATTAAVPNVPSTPSVEIGTTAARKRRQPMCMPPSKRMTTTATTTTLSTVWIEA